MSKAMGIITGKFPQLPVFKTLVVIGGSIFLIQMAPIAQDARNRNECIESWKQEYGGEYDVKFTRYCMGG
jgi:hypothetical protein